jgi:hypothetical protein
VELATAGTKPKRVLVWGKPREIKYFLVLFRVFDTNCTKSKFLNTAIECR